MDEQAKLVALATLKEILKNLEGVGPEWVNGLEFVEDSGFKSRTVKLHLDGKTFTVIQYG
jgi:hypothetical protein